MASGRSDRVQPQLDRLFRVGAVGTMSDAQLLDRFATRRDAAGEAAFEELVIRHGPMVLRITRSVLHHAHDAEDAFQAVFLILANRAASIRRKTSLASWLFGVAQRVATRARRTAARRRLREQRVAAQSPERTLDGRADLDWEILHEEVNSLPERLRAPIVLCYLEGLTYAAAARRLGLSEMAVRGRLARARAVVPAAHAARRHGVGRPSGGRRSPSGSGGSPAGVGPIDDSHRAGLRGRQPLGLAGRGRRRRRACGTRSHDPDRSSDSPGRADDRQGGRAAELRRILAELADSFPGAGLR